MIANSAISLVERAQDELVELAGFNRKYSYAEFINALCDEQSTEDEASDDSLLLDSKLDELVDLRTFHSLYVYSKPIAVNPHDPEPDKTGILARTLGLLSNPLNDELRERHGLLVHLIFETIISHKTILEILEGRIGVRAPKDAITEAFMGLDEQKLTAHTVFAASILLCIHGIMGDDIGIANSQLQNHARYACDALART